MFRGIRVHEPHAMVPAFSLLRRPRHQGPQQPGLHPNDFHFTTKPGQAILKAGGGGERVLAMFRSGFPEIIRPIICSFALRPLLAILLAALTAIYGCYSQSRAQLQPPLPPYVPPAPVAYTPPPQPKPPSEHVRASWYGPGLEGKKTSSGTRFHSREMTAASKTLPLGSKVVVTNPKNGKSVEVKITDRGPHVRGRSMDLSKGAARRIALIHSGVADLRVTRVDDDRKQPKAKASPAAVSPSAAASPSSWAPPSGSAANP